VVVVPEGWSVLYICGALFVGAVVWTSHLAVHTQAKLAARGEHDGLTDAFVWINRQLTGKPSRQSKTPINPPPQT
jgi:hypothetical protein